MLRHACLVGVLCGVASAEGPVLRVGARTRLDLTQVKRQGQGVIIRGVLMDAALDEPIAHRTVAIRLSGPTGTYAYAEPTALDGTFRWEIGEVRPGPFTLSVHAGLEDTDYAPSTLTRPIDLNRRTPAVTLEGPASASVTDETVDFRVKIEDPEEEEALAVPYVVMVDERAHARGRTSQGGVDGFTLPVHEFGPPGAAKVVTVRFAGDALYNAAEASRTVRLTTPTTVTLEASSGELAWDGRLRVWGALAGADGPAAGIGGATVDVWVSGLKEGAERRLGQAQTDARGAFSLDLRGGALRPGTWFLEARHQPTAAWRLASRSTAVALTQLPPPSRSRWFYLSPLSTLMLFAFAQLVRTRPFGRLREKRRAREQTRTRTQASGLSERRRPLYARLGPPHDHGLSGQVCEHPSGQPLSAAVVRITAGDGVHTPAVDEGGRFAVEGLPGGKGGVLVRAPGFVAERFEITLPHKGELRHARILLQPIRARIFEAYRQATRPLDSRAQASETTTPRELLHQQQSRSLLHLSDLAALVGLVEEACFAARLPDEAVLAEAERLAARVDLLHKSSL